VKIEFAFDSIEVLIDRLNGELERAVRKGDLREAEFALGGKDSLVRLENELRFSMRREVVTVPARTAPKRA
jgi:hypothetical protein